MGGMQNSASPVNIEQVLFTNYNRETSIFVEIMWDIQTKNAMQTYIIVKNDGLA